MKKQGELFELIKSLSKQEKVHFKMMASRRRGEKKYLLLFDAMDAQAAYDEQAIRQEFRNEPFMRQLPVAKNFLYANVLKALRVYHSSGNLDNALKEGIAEIEILYNKSLFTQAERLAKRLYEKARRGEKHMRQLEIMRWQRNLQRIRGYPGLSLDQLEKVLEEEAGVIEKIRNSWRYDALSDKYFLVAPTTNQLKPTDKKRLEKLRNDPLLKNEKLPLTNRARSIFHRVNSRLSHNLGDVAASYAHGKAQIELIEQLPHEVFEEERYNYIVALYNQLIALTYLKKHKAFEESIAKLRRIKPANAKEQMTLFYTYLIELDYYITNKRYEDGCALETRVAEGLRNYAGKINLQVEQALAFNLCTVFIYAGGFSKALTWANTILNNKRADTGSDIYCVTRLLYLLIHFELGNFDTLSYLAQSTNRFLKKQAFYGELEELLLHTFSMKLPAAVSRRERTGAFTTLKKELEKRSSMPEAGNAGHYFDFADWVNRKLGKS